MVPGESSHPDGSEYVWQRGVQSLYGRVREPMIEQLTMRSGGQGYGVQTSFVFLIIMMMILFVNIIKFKHSRSPASLGLSTISSWFLVRIMEGPIPSKNIQISQHIHIYIPYICIGYVHIPIKVYLLFSSSRQPSNLKSNLEHVRLLVRHCIEHKSKMTN